MVLGCLTPVSVMLWLLVSFKGDIGVLCEHHLITAGHQTHLLYMDVSSTPHHGMRIE